MKTGPTITSFTRLNSMNKLIFIFLLFTITSCTKDKTHEIVIDGYVYDESTKVVISGAKVVVVKEKCCGSCNWQFIDSISTDEKGFYEFNVTWSDRWSLYGDSYVPPNYKIIVRKDGRIEGEDGSKQIDNSNEYQRINFDLPVPKYTRLRVYNDLLVDFYKKLKIFYRKHPDTRGADFCGYANSDTTIYSLKESFDTTFVVETGSIKYGLGGDNSQYDKWSTMEINCTNSDTCSSLISY